jgi:hypothetical protein
MHIVSVQCHNVVMYGLEVVSKLPQVTVFL